MASGAPRLAGRLRALLHLDDPPERIALALAVGVFISCTPLWGLQTLLSVAVAVLFGLNRAATLTGTWLNLPWFAPFVYGLALRVGTLVVPDPDGVRGAWLAYVLEHPTGITWPDVVALFEALSGALLIGTTLVGLVAGAATYAVAYTVLAARRGPGPDQRASGGGRRAA